MFLDVPRIRIMFIRHKKNKSGVISIQIIDKSRSNYKVLKTIGSSNDAAELQVLLKTAQQKLINLSGQFKLNFDIDKEKELISNGKKPESPRSTSLQN